MLDKFFKITENKSTLRKFNLCEEKKKRQIYKPGSVPVFPPDVYHLSSPDFTIGIHQSTLRDRASYPFTHSHKTFVNPRYT